MWVLVLFQKGTSEKGERTDKRYNFVKFSIFAIFPRVSVNQVHYSSSVKLSRYLQMLLPRYAENIRFVIKVRHSFLLW
jgi:hypothetical protein